MTGSTRINSTLILSVSGILAKLSTFLSVVSQIILLRFLQLNSLISNDDAWISERGK